MEISTAAASNRMLFFIGGQAVTRCLILWASREESGGRMSSLTPQIAGRQSQADA
ncbi:hypothetical protein ABEX47_27480 [Paenibacillus ehimensis]|uniref:hypothetical protein n=1 Tax=Paenibacillus ehimensis TaxID=79264 RepID=UPI001378A230|nr:hypothetical protein [Paenibacillus ehimensis]